MKLSNKLFFLIGFFAIVFSCKKEKDASPTTSNTKTYPNYSQLKVGNYWIYQQFNVDTSGNATPTNVYDSCYVEKDTLVRGMKYFKFVKPDFYIPTSKVLRDSLSYIVDTSGHAIFSSEDFSKVFRTYYSIQGNDTVYKEETKMADKDIFVQTPAGLFKTMDGRETYFISRKYAVKGNEVFYKHFKYSENIGIVMETLPQFLDTKAHSERRLVRYHLN